MLTPPTPRCPSSPRSFLEQLSENIKRLLAELSNYIGMPTESAERHELANLIGLFCFHSFLASQAGKGVALDKRTYQSIWALCKKVPLVPLGGVAMWRPLQFLARVLPIKSSSLSVDAAAKAEQDNLKKLDADLAAEVASLRLQVRDLPRSRPSLAFSGLL